MLYYDNRARSFIPPSDLPRASGGAVCFLQRQRAHTEGESIDSWEGIYGKKAAGDIHDDLERLSRLAGQDPDLFVYNNHVLSIIHELSAQDRGAQDPPARGAALEVGCGTASMALLLNQRHGYCCYGVDISERAVSLARERFSLLRADPDLVSVADISELPFADGAFQLVFGKTVFEHFEKPALAAAEITRVLAPGGYLVLDVTNKRNSYWTFASERARGHTHTTLAYTIEELSGFFTHQGLEIRNTWGDSLLYTTPYILYSSLFKPGKEGERGPTPEVAAANDEGRCGSSAGSGRLLGALAPLDTLFKRSLRTFNRAANRWRWANSRTGVLIGVVAQKATATGS